MKKIFLNQTNELPALYMDMVFVESVRPILFTCMDENSLPYICSCCYAGGDMCIWVVADTTLEEVISLLSNQREIWDMFGTKKSLALVTKYSAAERPEIQLLTPQEVPAGWLPTKGYGMDAGDGEFEEELKELQSRLENSHEYEETFALDSFYTITQKIRASIKPNVCDNPPKREYWEYRRQMSLAGGVI